MNNLVCNFHFHWVKWQYEHFWNIWYSSRDMLQCFTSTVSFSRERYGEECTPFYSNCLWFIFQLNFMVVVACSLEQAAQFFHERSLYLSSISEDLLSNRYYKWSRKMNFFVSNLIHLLKSCQIDFKFVWYNVGYWFLFFQHFNVPRLMCASSVPSKILKST